MIKKKPRNESRLHRHQRVRRKIVGTPERPRLNVFRSHNHIYAQVIDDTTGRTLAAASTLDPDIKSKAGNGGNMAAAAQAGALIAARAMAADIKKVVFDRGGYLYHGRVKALADAARKEGIEF